MAEDLGQGVEEQVVGVEEQLAENLKTRVELLQLEVLHHVTDSGVDENLQEGVADFGLVFVKHADVPSTHLKKKQSLRSDARLSWVVHGFGCANLDVSSSRCGVDAGGTDPNKHRST